MESRRTTRRLLCNMSEHEQTEKLSEIMEQLRIQEGIENEKKEALAQFGARAKGVLNRLKEIREQVDRKAIEKDVMVEISVEGTTVTTKRLDTNAIIDVRQMTEEERQGQFIFDEPQIPNVGAAQLAEDLNKLTDEIGREVTVEEVTLWDEQEFTDVARWVALSLLEPDEGQIVEMPVMPAVLKERKGAKKENGTAEAGTAAAEGKTANTAGPADDTAESGADKDAESIRKETEELRDKLVAIGFSVPYDIVLGWDDEEFREVYNFAGKYAAEMKQDEPELPEIPAVLEPF